MHFEVLSLFPQYLQGPLDQSILKRAIESGHIRVTTTDIRDYTLDPMRRVDDRPYGGGPGMVMMADPVIRAVQDKKAHGMKVIYLSPQGRRLTPLLAKELAQESSLLLLCGHYEGIDQRAVDAVVDYEVSIGDYVLTNGCLAALVVIDVISRYIPGVLGDQAAAFNDSFESYLLDFPHYTKPDIYDDEAVPAVLKSGNHAEINLWRCIEAAKATWKKRPDLMVEALFSPCDTHGSDKTSAVSLSHIALPAPDVKKSLRFYERLIGRAPDRYIESPASMTWNMPHACSFSLYQGEIESARETLQPALQFQVRALKAAEFIRWAFSKKVIEVCESSLREHIRSPQALVEACKSKKDIFFKDPAGLLVVLSVID